MAGKPPAGKGHQGRGYGPAALDDHVVELTFRVGGGQAGMRPIVSREHWPRPKTSIWSISVYSVCFVCSVWKRGVIFRLLSNLVPRTSLPARMTPAASFAKAIRHVPLEPAVHEGAGERDIPVRALCRLVQQAHRCPNLFLHPQQGVDPHALLPVIHG